MSSIAPGDGSAAPPVVTDPGGTPPAVLTPEAQVVVDAQSVAALHLAYDIARDALTAAKVAHQTVADQVAADVAAAEALAAQKVAGSQAVVDQAQAAADAAHKTVGDQIAALLKDAQGLD